MFLRKAQKESAYAAIREATSVCTGFPGRPRSRRDHFEEETGRALTLRIPFFQRLPAGKPISSKQIQL
ncbi:MAG: hypothetical protein AMXMBFR7_37140 [Planctomycetota bacterium]